MHIGILGINHKKGEITLRERLRKAAEEYFQRFQNAAKSVVLLATCNRFEVYFSSDAPLEIHSGLLSFLRKRIPESFEDKIYAFFGKECFFHLVKVTSGLDSAVLGETEIQGQVKRAYETASTGHLCKELHFLFQKALKIGKESRTRFPFRFTPVSFEEHVAAFGKKIFSQSSSRILFVGASATNEKIADYFYSRGSRNMFICNRTYDNAVAWNRFDCEVLPWSKKSHWKCFDWVIAATHAPSYLLDIHDLRHPVKTQLILDLSVPRNADPALVKYGIRVYNIDDVHRMLTREVRQKNDFYFAVESFLKEISERTLASFERRKTILIPQAV